MLKNFFDRNYLHPLAKFPGPKLTAATGWCDTHADFFVRSRGNFKDEIVRMYRIHSMTCVKAKPARFPTGFRYRG